ncbi:unnamed protein product [Acanthoscelides obtectus]|uniref:DUF8206 domain-containing protein n=1 Tax=Acanthoscelides obtectus TaxID=200917 RepID=A0A9P0JPW1_ACAOB|nr:unnamed protein product [Acanthoscelides obtectus]CAH1955423.1 unnamed protein product [Acanthoscelides obtectus]CAK1672851.1 hypothetical protein AOBTE_LOCUS29114 [Acanthoscelides obtectus]CAK1672852.1 hypothetical protein AOBTE_LOCUS29114 [Acanthoscelides obtectus]
MSVENLDELGIQPNDQEVNILLVGETGVGKSTFINSFANYLSYKYIDRLEERKEKLHVLIPSTFQVKDKDGQIHDVKVGNVEKNEYMEVGASATQGVQPYVFGIYEGRVKVRVIDTPGIGDTRSIQQDEANCENIIGYVKNLNKLHAICLLFRPNVARLSANFEYCLVQLLSRLDKSACKNIFFIFTNTRTSEYGPGDTLQILQKAIENIRSDSGVMIPLNKNIFCFENEAFRYLAAAENNIQFDAEVTKTYRRSWEISAKQCWNMLRYINGGDNKNRPQCPLEPYNPSNVLAINVAKNLLVNLTKVLAKLFNDSGTNNRVIERLRDKRDTESLEVEALYKQGITVKDVEKLNWNCPILVCASSCCTETLRIGEETKRHYTKVCHMDCNDVSQIEYDIIGNPLIAQCAAIDNLTRHCLRCGCDFSMHMHIKYITKLKDIVFHDSVITKTISEKENLLSKTTREIEELMNKDDDLKLEQEVITTFCAKLAKFLKGNAIMAFSDSLKEYIMYRLNQKQISFGLDSGETEEELKKMLNEFEETKRVFKEMLDLDEPVDWDDNPLKHIEQGYGELVSISNNKDLISLYENEVVGSDGAFKVNDYVHKAVFRKKDFKKDFDQENIKKQWKDKQNKKKKGGNEQQQKKDEPKSDKKKKGPTPNDQNLENKGMSVQAEKKNKGGNDQQDKKEEPKSDKKKKGAIAKEQNHDNQHKKKKDGDHNKGSDENKDGGAIPKKQGEGKKKNKKQKENNDVMDKKLKDVSAEELKEILDQKLKLIEQQKEKSKKAAKADPSQAPRSRTPPPPYTACKTGPAVSAPSYPPQNYASGMPQHPYYPVRNLVNNGPGYHPNTPSSSDKNTCEIKLTINDNRGHRGQQQQQPPTSMSFPFPAFPLPSGASFPPMSPPGAFFPPPFMGPQSHGGPSAPPQHFNGPASPMSHDYNRQSGQHKNFQKQPDNMRGRGGYRGGGKGGFKPHFKPKKGGKKQNDDDDSDTSVSSRP